MFKKSQVTAFIVIGIILLLAAGTIIYVKSVTLKKIEGEVLELPTEPGAFNSYIESCIIKTGKPLIKLLGEQGGTLSPLSYRHYDNLLYSYLCLQEKGHGCVNSLTTRQGMQEELDREIKNGLADCINLMVFKEQGYKIKNGDITVTTAIGLDDVLVKVNYPITIAKGDFALELEDFSVMVKNELGRLYDLAVLILNDEIDNGFFDKEEYMAAHTSVNIQKHRPYPDIVYSLKKLNKETDEEDVFNFAVNGKDTVSLIGQETESISLYGYCKAGDGNCYSNAKKVDCEKHGEWSVYKPGDCKIPAIEQSSSCSGGGCKNCGDARHGESWCVYDSIVGTGFDYAGSRHYKHSCIDGNEYVEECRDYREELCTQTSTRPYKAVCRPNRWQDCAKQLAASSCLDSDERDCSWSEGLVKGNAGGYGVNYDNRRCYPYVPPGFRFWQYNGMQACSMANEQNKCDEHSCPQVWVDSAALYCSYQGDCGNKRNIADKLAKRGFYSTDIEAGIDYLSDYVYFEAGLPDKASDYVLNLRTDIRDQLILNGKEFEASGTAVNEMMDSLGAYLDVASSWDYDDFKWDYILDGEVHYHTLHTSICAPWQAPDGGKGCDKCIDPLKPCTEYKCKSLGQTCLYEEVNGIGNCFDYAPGDNKGPVISYDGSIIGNFTVEEDYFLDHNGYVIEPAFEPYSVLIFVVNLSEEAQCKVSPLPAINYSLIPLQAGPFAKLFPIVTRTMPKGQLEGQLLDMADMKTFLQLGFIETYDRKIDEMSKDALDVINEFSKVIDDSSGKAAQINRGVTVWKTITKPMLEEFFGRMGKTMNELLVQTEMGNVLLFIKCIDKAGNENQDEFFIKYSVGDDTRAAIVQDVAVEDGSAATEPVKFRIGLNEPAVCRYSIDEDAGYESMPYAMDCAASSFASESGLYYCQDDIAFPEAADSMAVYVKCKDQPAIVKSYFASLSGSGEFSVADSASAFAVKLQEPNIINVTRQNALNNLKVNINTTNAKLIVGLNREYNCRYSSSDIDYGAMPGLFNCAGKKCEAMLSAGDYFIKCIGRDASAGNINADSYKYIYYKS